ncbi:MAG: DUF3556 domain-containing protein [Microthrixaceae bacterium]|nr:DUF3556 domain-containing protein [Microthrixaceae bacterium]
MGFTSPTEPEFEIEDWAGRPYPERVRMMCDAWAMQGFGAPGVAYLFYILKIGLYIGGFLAFAVTTEGGGSLSDIGDWWANPVIYGKAVLWTLMYEALGLGCGSGPLTGRYTPPVTAVIAFTRIGSTRLRPFTWVPFTAGHKRTILDVGLYVAFLAFTVRALLSDDLLTDPWLIIPILASLGLAGLRDKAVFLAGRSEHFLLAAFVLLFAGDVIAGEKAVQAALWFWAATSKLNLHFPNVIAVMMSNNPLLRSKFIRRKLYRNYPEDMRGSRLAERIAHGATAIEYFFPFLLVFGPEGRPQTIAIVAMVAFHTIILTSFPLGVPLEWNVFFIYSTLALFGVHADVRFWHVDSPLLAIVLLVCLVAIPIFGNLRPDKISFLPSMRYYAGNWAISSWLFRPGRFEEIEDTMGTVASTPRRQVEKLYGEDGDIRPIVGRAQAFRAMHLHGRAMCALIPEAVEGLEDDDVRDRGCDAFEALEGEFVAGLTLGWNFGDGHLHNEQLMEVIQAECNFGPGEVRAVMIESQPFFEKTMHWRIVDAHDGLIAEGHVVVADLLDVQPWASGGLDLGRVAPSRT